MRTLTPEVSSPALTATVGELDAAPAARAASIERPAGLTLSDELIQDIRNMPHGSRPDPKTYTAPEVIAEHLGHFDEGAARYMTETNLQKYGIGQRDGTAFVIPAAEANALEAAAAGSATKLEKALGLPEGLLQNNNLVRVDIPKPRELDLRMPSGNEAGANSQWIPGGRLPGGGREAVISVGGLQAGQYSTRVVAGRGGNPANGFAIDANSTKAAFDGALYPPNKLRLLVPYLEKRGVSVYGTNGNPRFDAKWNGTGTMYLPENPTALQVKHELSHYLDFKNRIKSAPDVRSGVQSYVDMGRIGREESVLNRLQSNRIWAHLNEAEKDFSISYVNRLKSEGGQ